ncbi:MAG: polysaccharide biosynthesis C-terminal domain-containing protein [Bacteroidetes bacterium]|nr:polysaccharide biosynthesis C-terminal domain-containing protein [Bacteroidota bacterium]
MSVIKKLAGQTATYGLSSILGRLLNYLLVPLYTRVFHAGEYGVVTEMYAYVSFFNIVFTYGLETAYFRFFQSEKENPKVYSTTLISILTSSVLFAFFIIFFSPAIAGKLNATEHSNAMLPEYISWFAAILAFDAVSTIPFAKLRQANKAKRFVFLKLLWIVINIGLNLFFLVLCPKLMNSSYHDVIRNIYNPSMGVGYVFISNLVASAVTLLFLSPELFSVKLEFDRALWKSMIVYSLPIMVAGFAGMINETFDRIMLPRLVSDPSTALEQNGIYGACYKLSILMTLFVQTFRYAAEPFFFSHASKENAKEIYSKVMHYFVLTCSFIFLTIMMYMDLVKKIVGEEYRSGIKIVPILLMANLCLGVYYNLSIWYKLTGRTRWAAWISVAGAVVTLLLNYWLIPVLGYMGAAWTTLICYASMMVISYVAGQKYYHVDYNLRSFALFVITALLLYAAGEITRQHYRITEHWMYVINSLLLVVFLVVAYLYERGKNSYLRMPVFNGRKPGDKK